MGDGIFTLLDCPSARSSTAGVLERVRLRVRRCLAGHRPRESLAHLNDWLLRDIGVIRERDLGTSLDVDPREAAERFWRS